MITLKSAGRLRRRAIPLMAAAVLLVGLTAEAQQRSRPGGSSSTGRSAHGVGSRSSGAPSPSQSPSAGSPSRQQPRTAHPSDGGGGGEPHRQRPHNPDNDGHHHGHGGYYGGYYGGYPYYGYGYGYGYWPSFWWGWGWYGAPYYYPQPYYGGYAGGYEGEGGGGALDLDVAPGRTQVYLDGQYIGTVDAFDGWPRYLWLRKGTYDLVFYLDGYKTLARQITVYPGTVIDVGDRMEPGESVRPEDVVSKSTERRDERLRYERQRREEVEQGQQNGDYDEDWRDRVRRDRGGHEGEDDGRDSDEDAMEESGGKGRLLLEVYPQDASIYLDGRFVGTGTEIALMRSGLPISPGDHTLSIVRPGRKAEEREFTVQAGEEVELEVELKSESR